MKKPSNRLLKIMLLIFVGSFVLIPAMGSDIQAADLGKIRKAGKLRHLGIVYANFVTENMRGLDVELMQMFAAHLGVKYEFVKTNWQNVIADLTGKVVKPIGEHVEILDESPVRGDVIATGFTVLAWRKKIVDFSDVTFPTGVWLIARANSPMQPIVPTGDISKDIEAVKKTMEGKSVLAMKDSCLDPDLYGLSEAGAAVSLFPAHRDLDEMIPSVMAGVVHSTLMDAPVALIALEKWAGEIKVVGPVSHQQGMACAFSKTAPELRQAFNEFFQQAKADGRYKQLILKYYPSVFTYYPRFLNN